MLHSAVRVVLSGRIFVRVRTIVRVPFVTFVIDIRRALGLSPSKVVALSVTAAALTSATLLAAIGAATGATTAGVATTGG